MITVRLSTYGNSPISRFTIYLYKIFLRSFRIGQKIVSIKLLYSLSPLIFHLYQWTEYSDLIFFFFFLQRNSLANRIERRIYLGTKHHRRKGGQRSRVELMREESRSRLLLRRVKMPGMLNESFKKDGSMYAE